MDKEKICIAHFKKTSGVIYPQDYATGDGSISNPYKIGEIYNPNGAEIIIINN